MKPNNLHSEHHQQWLKELSALAPILAGMKKVNPFRVPDDYFSKNESRLSRLLLNLEKQKNEKSDAGFKVPENYFEELSESIMKKLEHADKQDPDPREEIKAEAPVLAGIDKKNLFLIPDNYFNQLTIELESGIQKIFPLRSLFKNSYFRISIAVAAVLTGAILTINLCDKGKGQPQYELTHEAVAEYVSENINDYSESNLIDFLDEDELDALYNKENNLTLTDEDIDQYLLEDIDIQNLEDWL